MNRNSLRFVAVAVVVTLACGSLVWAGDTSMLRPPKGSKVALLVFEDLQCPDCARAAPLLHEAAKKYNIPLVQYDFPLPMHNWSFEAAVNARYFDSLAKTAQPAASAPKTSNKSNKTTSASAKSPAPVTANPHLGDDYRLFIFSHQPEITPQNLRGITERFAADNKVPFPFVVDPSGELTAKVKADYAMGQRVGIDHTPTIYVVSDTARGKPFVEVADRSQLYQLIDQVIREAGPATPAPKSAAAKSTTASKTTKSQ